MKKFCIALTILIAITFLFVETSRAVPFWIADIRGYPIGSDPDGLIQIDTDNLDNPVYSIWLSTGLDPSDQVLLASPNDSGTALIEVTPGDYLPVDAYLLNPADPTDAHYDGDIVFSDDITEYKGKIWHNGITITWDINGVETYSYTFDGLE